MKKHNKKRNTAFLFEALIRELTKSIVNKDYQKKTTVIEILKKHFQKGSVLSEELQLYKDVLDTSGLDEKTAERLLGRAQHYYSKLNKGKIFEEQSRIIKKINAEFGSSLYGSFVPNYKSIATLAQIFGEKTPVKTKVLLEAKILESLTSNKETKSQKNLQPIDNLIISTFAKSFNDKYENLLPEQKKLLTKYIISTGLNEVDFKVFVSEELRRITDKIQDSFSIKEVKEDKNMISSTKLVLEKIEDINVSNISENDLLKIMKLQSLAKEYESDDN
jgi:hypothetical protein